MTYAHRPETHVCVPGTLGIRRCQEHHISVRGQRPETPAPGIVERAREILPVLRARLNAAEGSSARRAKATKRHQGQQRRGQVPDANGLAEHGDDLTIVELRTDYESCLTIARHGVPSWETVDEMNAAEHAIQLAVSRGEREPRKGGACVAEASR